MQRFDQTPREDAVADTDYLDDYRAAVERLRGETVAEIGGQPMPPEKLSMFAVMIASLPLMALLHPAIPIEPHGWQDGAGALRGLAGGLPGAEPALRPLPRPLAPQDRRAPGRRMRAMAGRAPGPLGGR